jgi:hypothetical protein
MGLMGVANDTEIESLGIVIASILFTPFPCVSLVLEFIIENKFSPHMSQIEVQTRLKFFWSAEPGLGIKESGVWRLPFMGRSGNVLQLLHNPRSCVENED